MENKVEMLSRGMLVGVKDVVLHDLAAVRVCEDQREPCKVGQIRVVLYKDLLLYYLVIKKEAGKVLAVSFTDRPLSTPKITVERCSLVYSYDEDGDPYVSAQDADYLDLYPHDYYARFHEDNFIAYSVLTDWKLSNKKDLKMFL